MLSLHGALPFYRQAVTARRLAVDLDVEGRRAGCLLRLHVRRAGNGPQRGRASASRLAHRVQVVAIELRSEEHTPDLQSLMRIPYAALRMKKKNFKASLPSSY